MPNIIHDPDQEIARQTARILLKTQSVLLSPSDPFTLTSGRKSPVYVDCRRLISFADSRDQLMEYASEIIDSQIFDGAPEIIAGGETAGIPYAALIAQKLNAPMIYVRKKPKGFGRLAQIEGALPETNAKAVLVEDLQTDGGSKDVFVKAMREAGIEVSSAFVIFHYGIFDQSIENMKKLGLDLYYLINWWHVLEAAREDGLLKETELSEVEAFLNNPDGWKPDQKKQSS